MMQPHYQDDAVTLYAGDCLAVLPTLPDNSVDAVVTDPPYGLEFMGKEWDAPWKQGADVHAQARTLRADEMVDESKRRFIASAVNKFAAGLPFQQWCQLWAAECLRVLRPGGHLLAFGGTRTWHRLAVAIEDAGFEIRDSIAWLYGSGFPKSLDVSKAIDRLNGKPLERLREFGAYVRIARETAGLTQADVNRAMDMPQGCGWWEGKGAGDKWDLHLPSLATWQRLKAYIPTLDGEWDWLIEWADAERAVIGPNPYNAVRGRSTGTHTIVAPQAPSDITAPATADAQRWQGWGTALKPAHEPIVVARKPLIGTVAANVLRWGTGALNVDGCRIGTGGGTKGSGAGPRGAIYDQRPDSPDSGLNGTFGEVVPGLGRWPANVALDETAAAALDHMSGELSSGSRQAGDYGLMGYQGSDARPMPEINGDSGGASRFMYTAKAGSDERITHDGIAHPTVKPLSLMRWLTRLVCPPGGTILEPFAGSGTTVEAALLEGFRCIAIEREPDYLPLITQRLNRRRDPVKYLAAAGEDLGLFDEDAS